MIFGQVCQEPLQIRPRRLLMIILALFWKLYVFFNVVVQVVWSPKNCTRIKFSLISIIRAGHSGKPRIFTNIISPSSTSFRGSTASIFDLTICIRFGFDRLLGCEPFKLVWLPDEILKIYYNACIKTFHMKFIYCSWAI